MRVGAGRADDSGRATVELLVKHGAKVVSIDLNNPVEPEDPYPDGVVFVQGSVT